MEVEYYIMEVEGEGCYCLCYDDENGKRIVIDWDLEIREDWNYIMDTLEDLINAAIKERTDDNEDNLSTEEIRLAVYEDFNDLLKYLMSDVAYG